MDFNSKTWKILKLVAIVAAVGIGVWLVIDNLTSITGWILGSGGGFEAGREIHNRKIDAIVAEARADALSTEELLTKLDNARGTTLISMGRNIFKSRN